MTTITLTENETKVLNVVVETEKHYAQLGEPGFSDVMFDDIVAETNLAPKAVKGVVGSLIKKDLVTTMDVNGEYNIYHLTRNAREQYGIDGED